MIVTQSPKIQKLMKFANRVGASSAPVLVTGESGTGKELFAQLLHDASSRKSEPLVRVNCAALSETLIESELFGHERGSFTDAVSARKGRFELADQGTLLLDEISEVPTATQAKLLRVLENSEFERVGSSLSIKHDVRIIASTNRDLREEVEERRFRLDLYHRINVVQIRIPALRERSEDVPILATHFVERFRHENTLHIRGFSSDAMQALADYDWPGNIRELRNVVHRACIVADGELIQSECLDLATAQQSAAGDTELPDHWLRTELADVERQIIVAAINKYGSQREVAKQLGLSPRTLTNKIRRYRESDGRADAA